MAHTDRTNSNREHRRKTAGRTGPTGTSRRARSELRALRREVPCVVGLLADERDFTAMRRYRSFAFDDHPKYLRRIDGLLRSLATEGSTPPSPSSTRRNSPSTARRPGTIRTPPSPGAVSPHASRRAAAPSCPTPDSPSDNSSHNSSTPLCAGPPGSTPPWSSPTWGVRRLRRGHRTRLVRPRLTAPDPSRRASRTGHTPPRVQRPGTGRTTPRRPPGGEARHRARAARRVRERRVRDRPRGGHRTRQPRRSRPAYDRT